MRMRAEDGRATLISTEKFLPPLERGKLRMGCDE
jgi:hypothetical protein